MPFARGLIRANALAGASAGATELATTALLSIGSIKVVQGLRRMRSERITARRRTDYSAGFRA